jgi:hypothetical protein
VGETDASTGTEAATRVVLLDVSQSLAAGERGIQAFERARALAAERLSYRPGLAANVILAGAKAEPTFARPSTNFSALRDELSRATVRPERLDVTAAIATAAAMFDDKPGTTRELIVVSDFQRGSWSRADFSVIPEDVKITFESVAPEQAPANVGLVGATIRNRGTNGGNASVEIEAANYGPLGRTIDVELKIGEQVRRLQASCAPYAKTTLATEITASAAAAAPVSAASNAPGAAPANGPAGATASPAAGSPVAEGRTDAWQWGTARLVGVDDALAADNELPIVGRVRAAPRTALVTRQSAKVRPSASYFLETALAPAARGATSAASSSGSVVRLDPSQKNPETAAGCDVIVVDRPGRLGDEWITYLVGAARRGRVLIYAAEEAIDATNLMRLAKTAERDWRFPVDFSPPPAKPRDDLFLAEVKFDRPPFSVFGEQASSAVAPLRFRAGPATTVRPDALADDLLAVYDDRTACLAVGTLGAGRIAVLNADLEASLLPRTEAFVPLVCELVDRMLDSSGAVTVLECGTPLAAYLPTDAGPAASLTSAGPDGQPIGRLRDEQLGVLWESQSVPKPGVYRVERGDALSPNAGAAKPDGTGLPNAGAAKPTGTGSADAGAAKPTGMTLWAAAAVIPAEESDLRTLPADVLTGRLAAGRTTVFRSSQSRQEPNDRRWVWLLAGCVGCMLAEIGALRWFRT